MGVAVLQLYPIQSNQTGPQVIETLSKRIIELGAVASGQFVVDCEVHQAVNTAPGQVGKNLYILHNSEYPATVFSVLESSVPQKTVSLTADTLFDLLMLKLTNVYKKKTTLESKGPRFQIKDFLVKLGSVTVGGVFKGILVEAEYCPGVVPSSCWSLIQEFLTGLLGPHPQSQGALPLPSGLGTGDAYSPSHTAQQYLEHFNQLRKVPLTNTPAPR